LKFDYDPVNGYQKGHINGASLNLVETRH
jgi:hypothetical protein